MAISGASGLTGSNIKLVVRLPSHHSVSTIVINGRSFPASSVKCFGTKDHCVGTNVRFAGSSSLRSNTMAGPPPQHTQDGSYSGDITVTSAMLTQLQERQAHYNIPWIQEDFDASWLVPSRLLLYIYAARP